MLGTIFRRKTSEADQMVLQRLCDEIPLLRDETATDYERVKALRLWIVAALPMAEDSSVVLDEQVERKVSSSSLDDLINELSSGRYTLDLHGMSIYYARLAALLGFETALVSFCHPRDENGGLEAKHLSLFEQTPTVPSSPRHLAAVVLINTPEGRRIVVQDPYFNFGLLDGRGAPADLRPLTRDLISGEADGYQPDLATPDYRRVMMRADDDTQERQFRSIVCRFEFFNWREWLFDHFHSFNLLDLFRFPASINPVSTNAETLVNAFQEVGTINLESDPFLQLNTTWDSSRKQAYMALLNAQTDKQIAKVVKQFTKEEIATIYQLDSWQKNRVTNIWEYERGETELASYPRDVCLPIADICNARCTFCTSWIEGKKLLKIDQLDGFEPLIRHALVIGLAGHGEPLSHPQLPKILARLADWVDSRARAYVITNGVYLRKNLDALLKARVMSFAFSLNAASAPVHETVMGLPPGSYEEAIEAIKTLVALREEGTHEVSVSISMVLNQDNVHEVADFVRLGNELRVDKVQLKTLAGAGGVIPGLNYHRLPPYLHPEFARHKDEGLKAIAESNIEVQASPESWDTPVFPAEIAERFAANPPEIIPRSETLKNKEVRKFYQGQEKYLDRTCGQRTADTDDFDGDNPYGRSPRYACDAPYRNLYLNDFSYSMVPCCYMSHVPGFEPVIYDGSYDFFEAWNSPAMVTLRRRLRDGPFFNMCTKCPTEY